MSHLSLFVPDLEGGGAEKMMVHLANEMSSLVDRVDLVVGRKRGPYLSLVSSEVNVVDIDVAISNPWIIVKLASYLRRTRPDAVLSAMTYPNVAVIAARRMTSVGVRVVISERVVMGVQASRAGSLRERIKPHAASAVYRQADSIVAISNGVAENLSAITGINISNIETIYNPVLSPELRGSFSVPEHPFYQERRVPVILTAGRLVSQKDHATLLSAFALLQESIESRLVILGQGPLREALLRQAQELGIEKRVSMPGYSESPYSYMAHSDLFVLSSAWEGFGNVLVEAMACGCPVISTDCPSGPSEILEEGRYGLLVQPGDAGEMARAMEETLRKPLASATLKSRAACFDSSKIARQYLRQLLPS